MIKQGPNSFRKNRRSEEHLLILSPLYHSYNRMDYFSLS